jgi:hypothetical protein
VYLADAGHARSEKLSPSGQPITGWGSAGKGRGHFTGLSGIAVDGDGNVYAAEFMRGRLQKLSPTGEPPAE